MASAFRVGDWLVEPDLGTISRGGATLRVEPKVMDVCVCLAEHAGRAVDKEQLVRRVWPDVFVTDDVLIRCISELRKAFADDPRNAQVIETIPRRGYRLVAPVQWIAMGSAAPQTGSSWLRAAPRLFAMGLFASGVVLLGGYAALSTRWPPPPQIRALAVLPLTNVSGNPAHDPLSDGMTEALITELGKIKALEVSGYQSALRYKGTQLSLQEIARRLGVDAVLDGSARQEEGRVVVRLRITHADTERLVWSASFVKDLGEATGMEGEMARDLAAGLGISLSTAEQRSLSQPRPVGAAAYEAYLKGRYHWQKRTEDGFRRSAEYLREAIRIEPSYARGHAALAECYMLLASFNVLSPDQMRPLAKAAAEQAIALDETLVDGHAALGAVRHRFEGDYTGAEASLKRAIELNPRNARARNSYAFVLGSQGRRGEALAEIRYAEKLDPLDLMVGISVGIILANAGQIDEAIAQYQKIVELDANYWLTHHWLGEAYRRKKMYPQAILTFERAVALSPNMPNTMGRLALTYIEGNRRSNARETLGQLTELARRRYVPATLVAQIHAALGEKNEALEWLEHAHRRRESSLRSVVEAPQFDTMRMDPRFADLLTRAGLGAMLDHR